MLDSGSSRGRSVYSPDRIFPFSPMKIVPLAPNSPSISFGRSGSLPPSCQYNVHGTMSPRAGNSYLMTDHTGAISVCSSETSTSSTLVGAPNFNAQFAPSITWHAMSPNAPHPKSHHPRQLNG